MIIQNPDIKIEYEFIKKLGLFDNDSLEVYPDEKTLYEQIQRYPRKYVNVKERINLKYILSLYKIPQYLPPESMDSNFFLDFQAIVFKKIFTHMKIINH